MRSVAKIIWPITIGLLLGLLVLKRGGSSIDNPLSADPVAELFSVSKR